MTLDNFPSLQPLRIADVMQKYHIYPDKGLGQSFLVDDNILSRITKAAGISPDDTVLEIGSGLGTLTRHLSLAAKKVVTVEIDDRLMQALHSNLQGLDNIQVVNADILNIELENYFSERYIVVANIPYYITSAIIRYLLTSSVKPRSIVLTVQKEVASRVCARIGDLNLLALSIQVYGNSSYQFKIPAGAFIPKPKVDSAVLRIDLYSEPVITEKQIDLFFKLINAAFNQKRKTIRNSLTHNLALSSSDIENMLSLSQIDSRSRPENLDIQTWKRLVEIYSQYVGAPK